MNQSFRKQYALAYSHVRLVHFRVEKEIKFPNVGLVKLAEKVYSLRSVSSYPNEWKENRILYLHQCKLVDEGRLSPDVLIPF